MRIEYIFSGGYDGQYSELVIDNGDLMLTFSKDDDSIDVDGGIDEADMKEIKELIAEIDWREVKSQYGEIEYNQYFHTLMIDMNEAQRYGVTINGSAYGEIGKDLDKLLYHMILLHGKYLHILAGRCNPKKMPFPFSIICDKNQEVSKRVLQDFIYEYRRSPSNVEEMEKTLRERWKNA